MSSKPLKGNIYYPDHTYSTRSRTLGLPAFQNSPKASGPVGLMVLSTGMTSH